MSNQKPNRPFREQLLIEPDVQASLLLRAALYGAALAIYFTVIQYFSQQMLHPEVAADELIWQFLDEAIYWGPGLMLLGPLFAYDLLKMSNRFAGPVFRLRREMTRLVNHESEVPISFRDDDYWHDVGDPFNKIRAELIELRLENAMLKRGSQGTPSAADHATVPGPDNPPADDSDEVEMHSDAQANRTAEDVESGKTDRDAEKSGQAFEDTNAKSATLQNA